MDNARINGVEKVERLDFEQLHNREPHISDKALGAATCKYNRNGRPI